jgi:hypothetical protein
VNIACPARALKVNMYRYLLVTCLFVFCAMSVFAQQPDTTSKAAKARSSKDTLVSTRADSLKAREFKPKPKKEKVYHPDSTHDPRKAVLRSLMIPGWGELYNHRWWQVPIIYAGMGLLVDAIIFNNTYYNEFLALSKYRGFGTNVTVGMPYYAEAIAYEDQPAQAIYDAEEGYRRNRDLSILGLAGAWAIQTLYSYIDAKFIKSYTMDNNFTMRVEPSVLNQPMVAITSPSGYKPGLKLTLTFR